MISLRLFTSPETCVSPVFEPEETCEGALQPLHIAPLSRYPCSSHGWGANDGFLYYDRTKIGSFAFHTFEQFIFSESI